MKRVRSKYHPNLNVLIGIFVGYFMGVPNTVALAHKYSLLPQKNSNTFSYKLRLLSHRVSAPGKKTQVICHLPMGTGLRGGLFGLMGGLKQPLPVVSLLPRHPSMI